MTCGLAELGRVVCAIGGDPLTLVRGDQRPKFLCSTCETERLEKPLVKGGKTLLSLPGKRSWLLEGAQAVIGLYHHYCSRCT